MPSKKAEGLFIRQYKCVKGGAFLPSKKAEGLFIRQYKKRISHANPSGLHSQASSPWHGDAHAVR